MSATGTLTRPSKRVVPASLADRALTMLVILILIDVFLLAPIAELYGGSHAWSDLVFSAVLVLGALAIWGDLWLTDVFVATGIVSIAIRIAIILDPSLQLSIWDASFAAANFLLLTLLGLRRVFAPGRINKHRILGAVAVYLLMGLLFGQIFRLVACQFPNAFLMLGQPATYEQIVPHLSYFSFVALTTLGFGDITPIHPFAKSFTLLAAVTGTLYPAVLIGRLVSQELLHNQS
jgi:Ion channel